MRGDLEPEILHRSFIGEYLIDNFFDKDDDNRAEDHGQFKIPHAKNVRILVIH
jgi:hypothetical protein